MCKTMTFLVLALFAGCAHTVKIETSPSASVYVDGDPAAWGRFEERTGWGKTYDVEIYAPCHSPKRTTLKQSNLHSGMFVLGFTGVPLAGAGVLVATAGLIPPLGIAGIALGTYAVSHTIVWNSFQLDDTYQFALEPITSCIEEQQRTSAPPAQPPQAHVDRSETETPQLKVEPIPYVPTAPKTAEPNESEQFYWRQRSRQLLEIDNSIKAARERRTNGLLLLGAGTAVSVASILAWYPSEVKSRAYEDGSYEVKTNGNYSLMWAGMAVGSALDIAGVWMFVDGWWSIAELERRRLIVDVAPRGDGGQVAFRVDF